MNEKFTPGPWTTDDGEIYSQGEYVATVWSFGEQGKSDDKLIAAAPEMYKSNETTLRELKNIVSGLDHACGHCDRYLMRGKRACRNCAAEKAKKIAQGMRDRISELQKKARGEQEK